MHTSVDTHVVPQEERGSLVTTLFDLIEALHTEIASEEDDLVIAIIAYLLCSGRLTFLAGDGGVN